MLVGQPFDVNNNETLFDAKKTIEAKLAGAGIDQAGLEAMLMLERNTGVRRFEFPFTKSSVFDRQVLYAGVARRCGREPLAYIEEEKAFYGLDIYVNPDVLIPRPETELLVEAALEAIGNKEDAKILEVGTGSGAIAVAICANNSRARVLASDISLSALGVARVNVDRHELSSRISLVCADLLSSLRSGPGFDLIISNPPYVPSTDIDGLEMELSHEPRIALDGGPVGLDIIKTLIDTASDHLTTHGILMFECGWGQSRAIRDFIGHSKSVNVSAVLSDYAGIERIIVCSKAIKE